MTASTCRSKSVRVGQAKVNISLDDYVDGKPTSALLVLEVHEPDIAGVVKEITGAWDSEEHAFHEVEPKALDWARQMNTTK